MSISETNPENGVTAGRRLTLLYIAALTTVAVLSIGAQWLIQWQLDNGESDSRVINVAGRQRMLSQRIAKVSLRVDGNETPPTVRGELSEALAEWSASHLALQAGDAELALPGESSPRVTELYAAIEPDFLAIRQAASALIDEPSSDSAEAVATIQRHEAAFLEGMDAVVSQYVVEAERRVERLRLFERGILGLTLAVLLAEGLLIFRPAVRHITETTEGLQRARDEAEEANAAKTRFLANVSHELRTPMTAVLGMTELARETESQEKREQYLGVVEEAGETLLGLLNDLIEVARIDSVSSEVVQTPFRPRDAAEHVGRLMERTAEERGLDLRVDCSDAVTVVGDQRRIGQVLLNLVSNAAKWTDEGSITIACAASQPASGKAEVRYAVRDTGVGISPEDQERLFEPFTQVGELEHGKRGGTGLGLAICRRLVDAMGGELELSSEPGVGTEVAVRLTLPIGQLPDESTPSPESVPQSQALRVLVVEDTEANRLLLDEVLTSAGHTVALVESGEAALESYRHAGGHYDAVLIDLHLPGIDGVTTARRLAASAGDLGCATPRLVCITAHAPTDEHPTDPIFETLVLKPIDRAALIEALNEADPAGVEASEDEALDALLAEAFLRFAGEQQATLSEAIEAGRFADAYVVAHRFYGQVGYFSEPAAADCFSELEMACLAEDPDAIAEAWPPARDSLQRLVNRLRPT